jgi:hypothetical protein
MTNCRTPPASFCRTWPAGPPYTQVLDIHLLKIENGNKLRGYLEKLKLWYENRSEKNSAKIFMKQDLIDKLPPDVRKEFMKYAIKLSKEKRKQS